MTHAHFHVTYRDRDGAVQVLRTSVPDNRMGSAAKLRAAALRNAPGRALSAVRVYPPRELSAS